MRVEINELLLGLFWLGVFWVEQGVGGLGLMLENPISDLSDF